MIDKTLEITAFLKKHYVPGTITSSPEELQLSTAQLLTVLFNTFPIGCIDDYDLHEILVRLGYTPQKVNNTQFVWCLISKE